MTEGSGLSSYPSNLDWTKNMYYMSYAASAVFEYFIRFKFEIT